MAITVLEKVEDKRTEFISRDDVAIVQCRYCFNLDHWVPVDLVAVEVECRKCDVCPILAPLAQWDEHEEHGGNITTPLVRCMECPICGGIIAPDEVITPCRFCYQCQTYVPVRLWGPHQSEGCYGMNDPFA